MVYVIKCMTCRQKSVYLEESASCAVLLQTFALNYHQPETYIIIKLEKVFFANPSVIIL